MRVFYATVPLVLAVALAVGMVLGSPRAEAKEADWEALERQFRELPMEARRLTGPLFWLRGDEGPELLETMLEKVAESGNGCFTAESRPHRDWLGDGWFRDLAICLEKAKELDLKMWIFDERWWPSGEVGGRAPPLSMHGGTPTRPRSGQARARFDHTRGAGSTGCRRPRLGPLGSESGANGDRTVSGRW